MFVKVLLTIIFCTFSTAAVSGLVTQYLDGHLLGSGMVFGKITASGNKINSTAFISLACAASNELCSAAINGRITYTYEAQLNYVESLATDILIPIDVTIGTSSSYGYHSIESDYSGPSGSGSIGGIAISQVQSTQGGSLQSVSIINNPNNMSDNRTETMWVRNGGAFSANLSLDFHIGIGNPAFYSISLMADPIFSIPDSFEYASQFNVTSLFPESTSLTYLNNPQNLDFPDEYKSYSPTSIPEPTSLAIFTLGVIGLASRQFKKQS